MYGIYKKCRIKAIKMNKALYLIKLAKQNFIDIIEENGLSIYLRGCRGNLFLTIFIINITTNRNLMCSYNFYWSVYGSIY